MHFVIRLYLRKKNQRHLRQSDIFRRDREWMAAVLSDARLRNLESLRVSNQRRVVIEIANAAGELLRSATQHSVNDMLFRREILQIADQLVRPRRCLRQDVVEFTLGSIDAVLFTRIEIGWIPIERF